MSKTLRKIRIICFGVFAVEAVLLGTLGLFWYFNVFNIKAFPNIAIILISVVAAFLIADTFFVWLSLSSVYKKRLKNDLDSAALVGGDMQKAFDFGQIGLMVVDQTGTIMWTNSLFSDRQMDLVDTSAFDWQPQLKELVNAPVNKVIELEIKGTAYQVKFISESRLFIFRDVNEYVDEAKLHKEEATVLGVIMLDNYSDAASDTDESADYVNKIRGIITDYCRKFGVLLRRVKADTYFAVCNFASLSKMEQDGFSLLTDVRSAGQNEAKPLTLSIGFAHDFPDIARLNEMAASAVDVALSRGGDQAVVSQHGHDLRFFGGKTAAVESSSKVKVRSIADSVMALIKSASNVYVMGHTDLDMDALGSCLGIKAMCEYAEKSCKIVYNQRQVEKKTRLAFQSAFSRQEADEITISPEEALNSIRSGTLLIVCDVSVPMMTMAPKLLEKAKKIIVIDHHRRGDKFIESPVLAYIETSAASASELIAEMTRYATANPPIAIKSQYATIMLSGIFLDSNFFKAKATGKRTFEACEILKENGADNAVADDYLKDEYEEYYLISKIVSTMQSPHYGVWYCVSPDSDIIERSTLSKVANQLMQIKGVNAAFVIGKTDEKTIRLSARSDGTVNVQLLCEKMGGGGHFTMAAAAFTSTTIERVVNTLTVTLDDYLDQARSSVNQEGDN